MDKYVGKRLDGRYEIREIIGVGGMAVVYKAYDNQEDRLVAIKILKEEFLTNEEFLRRFKNESKAIAMLSHPNIVNVYDVSFGDLIQYIVMEYIEGITLKEFIEKEGSLRWKDAVHFTIQILKGLQHAHDNGIVHRDVKPQNIMVLEDGTIKVTDFGIARFARSDQRTITDKAIGSVHYISPEQARGEKTDEKADIYSVGVMLYEMLTGKLPFQADSAVSVAIMQLQREPQLPTEINDSIPQGLEQITMHAMQKSQERRYQSAAEMLCDLGNFRKDPELTFAYSYFVDNSPTKFVGEIVSPEKEEAKEAQKEKNNIIPILLGIAVTLVIALVVLALIFIPKLLSDTGSEIECPNFVGKKFADIKNDPEYTDNFIFNPKWQENEEYDYGYIYEQSIKEGSKVKDDTKITLFVSMGQSTEKVPDVRNQLESTAVSQLKAAGFVTKIVEEASEEYDAGYVIRTEPQHTTVVAEGETITIVVSTGKPQEFVLVPDVLGQPEEQAKKELQKVGLKPKVETQKVNITPEKDYQPAGNVLAQSPESSSEKVAEGTEIVLYISSGLYETDVEVSLPSDYEKEICTVSLWYDGKMVKESEKIDLTKVSKYTFKGITSSEKVSLFQIKIKPEGENSTSQEYQDIKVDFRELNKKNAVTVIIDSTSDLD
jgi:serine/threonine-protein kinase